MTTEKIKEIVEEWLAIGTQQIDLKDLEDYAARISGFSSNCNYYVCKKNILYFLQKQGSIFIIQKDRIYSIFPELKGGKK